MNKISLKPANQKDIATIYRLALKIWNHHYIPIIGEDQVRFMLENMYSEEALTEQMLEKKHRFYLVFKENQPIGYISISGQTDVFIHKFYIDQDMQSKGIGSEVINEIKKLTVGATNYRLTVNRKNYTAINFYFKNGFKIEFVEDFDIGNNYFMNDFIMLCQIK